MRNWIEIRNTTDELISRLENAYDIQYVPEINVPHVLKFKIPADDSKISNITKSNEYWLVEDDEAGTQTVTRKFQLQIHKKRRESDQVYIAVECLDYLSQLSAAKVTDYSGGMTIEKVLEGDARAGQTHGDSCSDATNIYVCTYIGGVVKIYKFLKSDGTFVAASAAIGSADGYGSICQDATYLYVSAYKSTPTIATYYQKYLKSDLSYVTGISFSGAAFCPLAIYGDYLYGYSWTSPWYYLRKWNKTFGTIATGAVQMSNINDIQSDGSYVYALCLINGDANLKIRKYDATTLALSATGAALTLIDGQKMELNASYLYVAGDATTARRYKTLDLSADGTYNYGNTVYCYAFDDTYVYVGGAADSIDRLLLTDMSLHDQSSDYVSDIISMEIDSTPYTYIYTIGTAQKIWKWSTRQSIDIVIAELLAYDMADVPVTIGDISDYEDEVPDLQTGDASVLAILLQLVEIYGGYIEVDNNRQLNWTSTIGENKGQQVRFRKNLIGIEREVDYTSLYNRIYAYGYRQSTGLRIRLSEIQADDYVEDAASQAAYGGIFPASFLNTSLSEPATVLEWANSLLAIYKDPIITYTVDVINLAVHDGFEFDKLQLGSTINVIDEDLDIEVSVMVVKINYPDLLDPQQMVLELSNVVKTLPKSVTQILGEQNKQGLLIASD